jgi:iron complex transport system substrate-binding protein
VNMETLVGTRPDVILMAYDGSLPKWFAAVDKAYQIPVVLMPNTSLDGLKTTALLTGGVLGPNELAVAREFVRYFDSNIQRVMQVTGKLSPNARPKVLHTSSAGIPMVGRRSSMTGSISPGASMQLRSWATGAP